LSQGSSNKRNENFCESGSSIFDIKETNHELEALVTVLAPPEHRIERLAETKTNPPTPVVSNDSHAIFNSDMGPGLEFLVADDSSDVEELETDLCQRLAKQTTSRSLKTNAENKRLCRH
jgi:hypothetical protein